jgi:glutamate N-acetyltransferase/amino-acid N-acetyltransferase
MMEWFVQPKGFKVIKGSVTAPHGFKTSSSFAGMKKKQNDVALLVSDVPAVAAGVFTTNRLPAAPVVICKKNIANPIKGIIINAKYANSFTGTEGMKDAEKILAALASHSVLKSSNFLPASTGIIGQRIPVKKILSVIPQLITSLSYKDESAPRAIMTTDTREKTCAVSFLLNGRTVKIGAMAKGAGMIAPNMATMLAFITTDAYITRPLLQKALNHAVQLSFNKISVDGDMSTNDSILLLANGFAANDMIQKEGKQFDLFAKALTFVCQQLALKIVEDGEGATKLVEIIVRNAASQQDATRACRAIAHSPLVKTAFFGEDLNWGRIVNAVGYSGARIIPHNIDILIERTPILKGSKAIQRNMSKADRLIRGKRFSVTVDLHAGRHIDRILTCDLSYDYVRINGDYRS